MAEKVSRDRGYRTDTIAISRDMGTLSTAHLFGANLSALSAGFDLGGNFGPEKKYLAPPPPKNSPQTPSRPLDPPPPARETPPSGDFQ